MAELKRGVLLKRRYRIDRVIGQGAMGAVYLARDESLPGAMWALKVLCESDLEAAEVAEAVSMFRREADICARLRHPGLPEIIDFFSENGCHVLVMELIQGETLDEVVERRRRPLTEAELLPLLVQLASCLRYLHDQQPHPIIFRDLKPSNCMVTADGKLKLIDFGIARHHKPGRKSDTVVIGTPGFCAPEQYGAAQTDARSDVYSLGAMAWHLLSGQDPSLLAFNFPPLRTVASSSSEAMEGIVARCVAFDPQGRYPSADELLADLRWAASQRTSASVPATAWRGLPSCRTNRLHRAGNRHLERAQSDAPAPAAVAFTPVRPQSEARTSTRIDRAFSRAWAGRTFRVWWGHGSVYTSRILALLFLVGVLSGAVHMCVPEPPCAAAVDRLRSAIELRVSVNGRYPDREAYERTWGQRMTTSCDIVYDVSLDRHTYTLSCGGRHDVVAGSLAPSWKERR